MTDPIKSLTLVEIDVDRCSLTYGTAPCTATLTGGSPTGTRKCFNTKKTCQDRAHFTNAPVTMRFAKSVVYLPSEFEAIPSIEDVTFDPGVISLGKGLGQRSSITITFKDHPTGDARIDPNLASRDYDPWRQGTFWGKFRARQPFVQGKALRWIDGTLGQSLAEMTTRHFIIESFDGPTPDGRYKLVAKDILKLADSDRAQAPALSKGSLASSITNSATSATLAPSGIGDVEYPASGWLNLGGKEIVSFTRSGNTLTLTRAQKNTTGVAHDSGTRAQLCLAYDGDDPAEIIADLLENHADVPTEFIPLPSWLEETQAHFRRLLTGFIAEPTGVNDLVSEICQQGALAIWWDDVDQRIRLQVLRAISTEAERFTSSNSWDLGSKEQAAKRLSRVWVYYGQISPLGQQDDPSNYRATEAIIDTDAEDDYGVMKVEKIYSRWIPFGGSSIAARLGAIMLAQYRDPPRRFTFKAARHTAASPTPGEGCRVQHTVLQIDTGAADDVPVQLTRVRQLAGHFEIEAEESRFVSGDATDLDNRVITIYASASNINLRTLHDETYPPPVGGETVTFIIDDYSVITSTSTSQAAVNAGTWPTAARSGTRTSSSAVITGLASTSDLGVGMRVFGTGIPAGAKILTVDSGSQVTLTANASSSGTATLTFHLVIVNLTVNGRLLGKGGKGGTGTFVDNTTGGVGGAGGPAFYTRAAIELTLAGDIDGGGGGGGGGGSDFVGWFGPLLVGGGGGGGTGYGDAGSGVENGSPGGLTSGGVGGRNGEINSGSTSLRADRAGTGGGPGAAGSNAAGTNPGSGGAAGRSVDGWSFVREGTVTGTYRGPKVN